MVAASPTHTDIANWPFPFSRQDWDHTPSAVQDALLALHNQLAELQQQYFTLQQQVDRLQERLEKTSQTSSKPPSSDSPFQKPKRPKSSRKRGARKGHPGSGCTLLAPTAVQHVYPAPCACGQRDGGSLPPYHTHQVIELPPIEIEITHFVLHQARCGGCGRLRKAAVPGEHLSGYGPRLTALIGELAGMHGTSRRLIQDFCHAVLHVPISLGAVQKVVDRVSHALVPHYEAIAALARQATVGYIDETPWFCHNTLQWLWAMTTEKGSLFLVHPNRSKDAFFALIEDWTGILVSDGYGASGAPSSTAGRHGWPPPRCCRGSDG